MAENGLAGSLRDRYDAARGVESCGFMSAIAWCFLCWFYIEGGIQLNVNHGAPKNGYEYHLLDRNSVRNPYGVIELGYEWMPRPDIAISLAARHESSIAVDRYEIGEDSIAISVKWKPFK